MCRACPQPFDPIEGECLYEEENAALADGKVFVLPHPSTVQNPLTRIAFNKLGKLLDEWGYIVVTEAV